MLGGASICTCGTCIWARSATDLPTLGKGADLPILGKGCDLPILGKGCDLPILGKGCDLPILGNGSALPTLGKGSDLPTRGNGNILWSAKRFSPLELLLKYEEEELPDEGWLSADEDADLATRGNGSTEDTSCRRCDTGTAVTQRRLDAYLLFPAATPYGIIRTVLGILSLGFLFHPRFSTSLNPGLIISP